MAKKDDGENLTNDDKFELLIQALMSRKSEGLSREDLAEILASNSSAIQKAMKPENDTHPGLSAFSHPKGDRAMPKPPLPFQLFWNNYPASKFPETETWAEWEMYAQLTPGEYTILRRDGSRMTTKVEGERDADGKLTTVRVTFPVSREEKWLVPPTYVHLYQLIHNDNLRQRFVEGMQQYFALTMGEPVGA